MSSGLCATRGQPGRTSREQGLVSVSCSAATQTPILAGEGDKAERLLKDHVLIQGERLADFIASFDAAA